MSENRSPEFPTVKELKRGYRKCNGRLVCLHCSHSLELGVIYPRNERLLNARRAMEEHLANEHGGPFMALASGGKGAGGLSEVQLSVMRGMYDGEDDAGIAKLLGNKAKSTVRNHRYQLRERYREAKSLVAMTELLREPPRDEQLVEYPLHIRADDMRLVVTEKERAAILHKYIPDERILRFPRKEKEKLVILQKMAEGLLPGRDYSEKEVNQYIAGIFEDYVILRRYLVEYGFLGRTPDGKRYWLIEA
ncbi:DUF2087 domain-containing protein [Marispirochaeta sp.]|uniref:DUF2087 domain-containing protein n=1 Tax=Marispirochaeta sp. TaxID=2038653 RepID=UPI0029C7027B|nr:DUF2087 domain-containing protein [Marispirochaeta sp.]